MLLRLLLNTGMCPTLGGYMLAGQYEAPDMALIWRAMSYLPFETLIFVQTSWGDVTYFWVGIGDTAFNVPRAAGLPKMDRLAFGC